MLGIRTKTRKVYDSLNNTSINAGSLTHFPLILSEEVALKDGGEFFPAFMFGLEYSSSMSCIPLERNLVRSPRFPQPL